jgi:hypothetical protein
MRLSKYEFLCVLLIIFFLSSAVFAAGTLTVEAVGDYSIYEDYVSPKLLEKGCLVQVILDRSGDGLSDIQNNGSIYPINDDVLLPVISGTNTFRIGDGLPPFAEEGQFSVNIVFDNEDPDPNYTGYKIYIRFWNSPSPQIGSLYGEAGPFIFESGLQPQVFNILQNGDIYTNKVLQ